MRRGENLRGAGRIQQCIKVFQMRNAFYASVRGLLHIVVEIAAEGEPILRNRKIKKGKNSII